MDRFTVALVFLALASGGLLPLPAALAQPAPTGPNTPQLFSPRDVLDPRDWKIVDETVDLALEWLARQQQRDGRFRTVDTGQPAVTSLCILAFLSRGHIPGEGPYGRGLDSALEFVLSCQQDDGIIAYLAPRIPMQPHNQTHTAIYNHAISALMLTEAYGMTGREEALRIQPAVQKAIEFTLRRQRVPKRSTVDEGGWRYMDRWAGCDSDLSVTSWQLMFLRSAKNAGFDVPTEDIDAAMPYVSRCFDVHRGSFMYGLIGGDRALTRPMAGAGVVSFSLGGLHDTEAARSAGDWILRHPFEPYLGPGVHERDTRYFYGAFYCSQATLQLGGKYWREFYPRLARVLVANQSKSGAWDSEPGEDMTYGNAYSTALAVLALTTPYQLLPIYQR